MKKFAPLLLLAIAVCGVYAPAARNGFVWDDTALVLRDPLIRSWRLIPEAFQHFLFTDATASNFYRPLQRLTYTAEYALFGFNAGAFHITSVLCHLAAALALLFFSRELLRAWNAGERAQRVVPLLTALLWAVHPVQSSAVVYVSGRADPLAFMFGFAALWAGLVSARSAGARHWMLTVVTALLFLLSALSKEAGLVFLALWLVIAIAQRKLRLETVAVIAVVLTGYFTLRVQAEQIEPPKPDARPALVRPILAVRALAEYAEVLVFPANLRMERDVETNAGGMGLTNIAAAARRELQTIAGAVLLGAFVYWAARERRRDSVAFLALLLAATSYLPVSGLVTLNATVAEHWLYVPSAFLFLAVVHCAVRFAQQYQLAPLRRVVVPALTIVIALLGGRTFVRTFDWKDQRTFLEKTIADGSDSARMLINLGSLELSEGHLEAAQKHLEAALVKQPEQPFAVINLAAVALKRNNLPAARDLLLRATKMPLVEARAHEMLALLEHKETGRTNLIRFRLAARTGTPDWSIEKRYVKVLAESGAMPAALRELQHCLQTQWYRAESWQLFAELAATAGLEPQAQVALKRAQLYDVRLHERAGTL